MLRHGEQACLLLALLGQRGDLHRVERRVQFAKHELVVTRVDGLDRGGIDHDVRGMAQSACPLRRAGAELGTDLCRDIGWLDPVLPGLVRHCQDGGPAPLHFPHRGHGQFRDAGARVEIRGRGRQQAAERQPVGAGPLAQALEALAEPGQVGRADPRRQPAGAVQHQRQRFTQRGQHVRPERDLHVPDAVLIEDGPRGVRLARQPDGLLAGDGLELRRDRAERGPEPLRMAGRGGDLVLRADQPGQLGQGGLPGAGRRDPGQPLREAPVTVDLYRPAQIHPDQP